MSFISTINFGLGRGGWVVSNILASDLANQFVCGALPHPSINLEERVYGGNLLELMSRINRPLLLMPARVSCIANYSPECSERVIALIHRAIPMTIGSFSSYLSTSFLLPISLTTTTLNMDSYCAETLVM